MAGGKRGGPAGAGAIEGGWNTLSLERLRTVLETTAEGLTEAEASRRLARFGANALPHKAPPTLLHILLQQLKSPLIYILAAAAAVSLLIGDPVDAAFIAGVVIVDGIIGGYQEWKAQESTLALQNLLRVRATVVRDGEPRDLEAELLVPGDLV